MEASGSSHDWARELSKLGHDVRLIPANYVKPYVKRGQSDANDAEAICAAVTRPTMRFVAPKSKGQQAVRFRWHEMRMRLHSKLDKRVRVLRTILGVGPVTASAIVATVGDAKRFKNGRPLHPTSSGDLHDSTIAAHESDPDRVGPWVIGLLKRKPARLAIVAMANKTARIVWAVLTRNEDYRPHTA